MALVIEDGSGKPDAQAYIDVAGARAYAVARGVTLSSEDDAVEVLLVKATDYIEAQRALYQGSKTTTTQALQWPRADVYIDGAEDAFDSATLPRELLAAQGQCVIELHNGNDLMPTNDGRVVKKKKVDVIETEYAVGETSAPPIPSFPKVDALLAPLFAQAGTFGLSTVRS